MENENTMYSQDAAILKELSDIKSSLAVNTSETANIKNHITEIKTDIKDIKALYVTQSEYKSGRDLANDHETRLRTLESRVWKAIGALAILQIVILPIVLYMIYKSLDAH